MATHVFYFTGSPSCVQEALDRLHKLVEMHKMSTLHDETLEGRKPTRSLGIKFRADGEFPEREFIEHLLSLGIQFGHTQPS